MNPVWQIHTVTALCPEASIHLGHPMGGCASVQLTFLLTAPKHLVAVQMYPRDTGKCLTSVQIHDVIKDKTSGSG